MGVNGFNSMLPVLLLALSSLWNFSAGAGETRPPEHVLRKKTIVLEVKRESGEPVADIVFVSPNSVKVLRSNKNGKAGMLLADHTLYEFTPVCPGLEFDPPSAQGSLSGSNEHFVFTARSKEEAAARALTYPLPLVVPNPAQNHPLNAAELNAMIQEAYRLQSYQSITYLYGSKYTVGAKIMTLDCSGFVCEALRGANIVLDQNYTDVSALITKTIPVWTGALSQNTGADWTGMVVCFQIPNDGPHCGIVINKNLDFIHCSATQNGIAIGNLLTKSPFASIWGAYITQIGQPVVGAAAAKAALASPASGSTFSGSSVTFAWNSGNGAQDYFLYVGSAAGANDIYGADQGLSLNRTVSGIPTDGRAIYVRLWTMLNGGWQFTDYTFFASRVVAGAKAALTSPANGSTFSGSSATFAWNAGNGAQDYFLYVGNTAGANDIYGADQGLSLSRTVSGIPTDGRTIFVRIWTMLNGGWQFTDYTFFASRVVAGTKAALTSPANGSTFGSSSVTFAWNAGSGAQDYFLYVGNAVGANDIYGADQGLGLNRTVSGIPTDGRAIYVRLWSMLNGAWQYTDYTFFARRP